MSTVDFSAIELPVFIIGEEVTTCPQCGSRTDFEEDKKGIQLHECLNTICCGFKFLGECEDVED